MDLRTDRVGLLLDQLATSCDYARARLEGMTDAEYLWEPAPGRTRGVDPEGQGSAAPGAWSVRPRGQAVTPKAFGPGAWVLDFDSPEPDPAPVTTMAWRLGHLLSGFAGRWEWTFGDRATEPKELIDFSPTAAPALEALWELLDRWRADVGALTDEQLDQPGFGQYPYGLDPGLPFIQIVWWTNREAIHHLAEVALLRDLWRAGGG
jgi:hypothetical protein